MFIVNGIRSAMLEKTPNVHCVYDIYLLYTASRGFASLSPPWPQLSRRPDPIFISSRTRQELSVSVLFHLVFKQWKRLFTKRFLKGRRIYFTYHWAWRFRSATTKVDSVHIIGETRKPTWTKGVENDASARPKNLSSVSCDLRRPDGATENAGVENAARA